jgi:hypothetical protein
MELLEMEFEQCRLDTSNFKKITGEILLKNRYYLEILRKLCNLTILEFDKIYFTKYGKRFRSSNYELNPSRKLGRKLSNRLAEILENKIKSQTNLDFQSILRYNSRINLNKQVHDAGNELELAIEKLLKKNNIQFEKHSRIIGKSGTIHKIDFLIGSRVEPRAFIEAKKSHLLKHNSMKTAKELVATSTDLNEKDLPFFVVLDTDWTKSALSFLEYYCKVFKYEDLDKLMGELK